MKEKNDRKEKTKGKEKSKRSIVVLMENAHKEYITKNAIGFFVVNNANALQSQLSPVSKPICILSKSSTFLLLICFCLKTFFDQFHFLLFSLWAAVHCIAHITVAVSFDLDSLLKCLFLNKIATFSHLKV